MNAKPENRLQSKIARIVLLSIPILLAFTLTAGGVTALLALWNGDDWFAPGNLSTGIICGLSVWLILTYFHLRRESVQVTFEDAERFVGQLREQLADLGYEVQQRDGDHLVSRPTFASYLFGGRLNVTLGDGVATLTGPRLFVDILRYRLRLFGLVAKTHHDIALAEGRSKQTADRYLRRVSLSLRLGVSDLPIIHQHFEEVLQSEGAEARCQLQVMIQKEDGISERVVEQEIRDWLRARGLGFDLQKDLVQWQDRLKAAPNRRCVSSPTPLPTGKPQSIPSPDADTVTIA